MQVDVALTPALVAPRVTPESGPEHVVIIDVLRATSTIVSALAAGAECVIPEGEVEAARLRARAEGALLGGERKGLPPPGFDLGNSPASFTPERCGGRRVVLSTTNGTQAVLAVRGAAGGPAPTIWSMSLLNAEATARALAAAGAASVLIVAAGTRGQVALDDVATAGCLAGSLLLCGAADPGDGARVALAVFDTWKHDLPGLFRRCQSGRRLIAAGLEQDLSDCARVDALPFAVRLGADGAFRLHGAGAAC
ncbi:MAG: 2-phosphosulfolactate phosphatase [Planctomycetota bacterium]